ncbi:MAG: hypothetical protein AAB432_03445 [Patescibacteria group bacterium]
MSGKLIVIYGINNLGKTTQAKLLVERIENNSLLRGPLRKAIYLKYPLYDLEPTGPMINAYLRKGNPDGFSPQTFQILNVLNRLHFQPKLQAMLNEETQFPLSVVAEDYWGTGLAWGMGAGVDKNFMTRLNGILIKEDIAFLFDGKRFTDGIEKGHVHETSDDLTERVRFIHLDLAKEFGWHVIDANRSKEEIHKEIWSIVEPLI